MFLTAFFHFSSVRKVKKERKKEREKETGSIEETLF